MISLEALNSFIHSFSEKVREIDTTCSVIQFGSSLHGEIKNGMDIDLLLLSEKNYFAENEYSPKLFLLKNNLIEGRVSSPFIVNCPLLETKLLEFISSKAQIYNVSFVLKFVFGPYLVEPIDKKKFTIYLHIKGPINSMQFLNFCSLFPFHAKSIIHNNRLITGCFNHHFYDKSIILKSNDYNDLIKSLNLRVSKAKDIYEIRKCIKKLLHNWNLWRGVLTNNTSELLSIIDLDFFYPKGILMQSDNLEVLKTQFSILSKKVSL